MTTWLEATSRRRPEALALLQDGEALNYAQLADCASRRAATLARMGLRSGDRVMLEVSVTLESATWLHALMWLGATIIPVGPLSPGDSARLSTHLEPRALITSRPSPLSGAGGPTHDTADVIVIDAAQPLAPRTEAIAPAPHDPDRTATIMLTSGSTSAPKAVPLTLANHAASAAAIVERLGEQPADRWLLCLPLEHIGGLAILLRGVIRGDAVALMPRFDPAGFVEQLNLRQITLTSLVPSMLDSILGVSDQPPPASLRGVFIGGAPAAPALLGRARDAGWPVLPTWGMTEAGSQLATPSPATAACLDFSAEGPVALPPLPGVQVRTAPCGALQVRGPMLFSAYLEDAAPGPDADGWFTTSDRGIVDADGKIRVLGRTDDVIISGGINVHLDAVADRLAGCPLIEDVAAVGIADPRWGQRIAAAVVVRESEEDVPGALEAWSREHLPPAERPARWRVVDAIPRSSAGKPSAPAIRALFE